MTVANDSLDLTPLLAPERASLLELLASLTVEEWTQPTECPEWNVKGIALHILGDDLSLLTRQRDGSTDSLTLFAETHPGLNFRELLDGFNDAWVATARFLSTDLLVGLLRLVGAWSDDFYRSVDLDATAREPVGIFAANGLSPYWQVIAREFVERVVHQSQIRRAAGRDELDDDLVGASARVQVHALGAWMRNDAPAEGSTIAVSFGDVGSWTWRRESDHWSVRDGLVDDPGALVSTRADRSAALITRGVSLDEFSQIVTVEGDTALAEIALTIMCPFLSRPEP